MIDQLLFGYQDGHELLAGSFDIDVRLVEVPHPTPTPVLMTSPITIWSDCESRHFSDSC